MLEPSCHAVRKGSGSWPLLGKRGHTKQREGRGSVAHVLLALGDEGLPLSWLWVGPWVTEASE